MAAADPVAAGSEVVVSGTADEERVCRLSAGVEQGEAGLEDGGTADDGDTE